ncbi:hypothetical protein N7471_005239 [Penicillium samsonianum]|uniref:uncharacterized protein n=1 Tax=Penicillium samsonianum TaxID=1882272 RepID=UPI00254717BA|nr:uncharacterized protein N7471_005239 [Penicillium samsonianum]KAJ6138753.1 hypothetical protein N7471_005239 [Penicillium samsonianum]
MSADDYKDICRDGFVYGLGRFQAKPGSMDRIEGYRVRSMFLPKLSREGQKVFRDALVAISTGANSAKPATKPAPQINRRQAPPRKRRKTTRKRRRVPDDASEAATHDTDQPPATAAVSSGAS